MAPADASRASDAPGAPPDLAALRSIRTGALTNRTRDAVFLAYHSVHPLGPRYLSVTPDAFERQLVTLARLGYGPGNVDDLARLQAGHRPPRPLAFITFDEGYRDTYEIAWPILRRHGFTGIVFVVPRSYDFGAFEWPDMRPFVASHPDAMVPMTWAMAEELAAAGMEFGSHTMTHPRLPELSDEALARELVDSRRIVQARLGRCDVLAYPFGDWDARVARAAAAAGYAFAFALPPVRTELTAMTIPRMPIDDADDRFRFRLTVAASGRRLMLGAGFDVLRRAKNRLRLR